MSFYFIVHTLLGILAGNAAYIQKNAPSNAASFPLWINSPGGKIYLSITVFAAIAAIITTLVQWNIGWTIATILEIIFGAFIVGLFPIRIKFLIALAGPVVAAVILGALWGFWRL
ncbi:hypothetical protein OAO48_02515 [Alphaproteobacteria bacterium]|jgi:hypothetical protein|nr:hypothetical protein [Alphaproteobacteria bacterium]